MCITFIFFAVFVFITIIKNNQFKSLFLFESENDFHSLSVILSSLLQMINK